MDSLVLNIINTGRAGNVDSLVLSVTLLTLGEQGMWTHSKYLHTGPDS